MEPALPPWASSQPKPWSPTPRAFWDSDSDDDNFEEQITPALNPIVDVHNNLEPPVHNMDNDDNLQIPGVPDVHIDKIHYVFDTGFQIPETEKSLEGPNLQSFTPPIVSLTFSLVDVVDIPSFHSN